MWKEGTGPDDIPSILRRAGAWITFIFWTLQYVELTIANWAADPAHALAYLVPRAAVVGVGVILTLGLVELMARRPSGESFRGRMAKAIAAVAAASALVAAANYVIYIGWQPVPGIRFDPVQFMYQFFSWSWFFASIAAAMLALSYSVEVRDRERRLAEAQSVAHSAQIRALRYQLNPHFLFNTLNSVAALIAGQKPEAAERMVETLSDFLRTSLELDPYADISLAQELELQSLYLGIETFRFPDRMEVEVDVPDDLAPALVPSLITQPLIENAVKYGVARSRSKVEVRIAARREGESLILSVSNSASHKGSSSPRGTGLGLANVAARLRARFGEGQHLTAGPRPDGGFEATLSMPLRFEQGRSEPAAAAAGDKGSQQRKRRALDSHEGRDE